MVEAQSRVRVLAKGVRVDEKPTSAPVGTKSGVNGCGSAGECLTISPEPVTPPVPSPVV